ncbi:MAG: OmpA family protein [Paludibacteraceae bacterium]|nr:OmpA family protein [Paludibacteraceae bacterium]
MHRHATHIAFVLSLLMLVGGLSGCGIKKQLQRADKKYAIGEYYEAANLYKKVYPKIKRQQKALKAEVAFKQGECYRIINHPRAVNAYKNAITYKYQLQDSIVYLRQAQVLHYQGKYSDALRGYEIYLESHPDDYVAQAGRYACLQMENWKKEPTRYKVKLASEFNVKRYSNFSPAFIGDDQDALMFTSNRVARKKKDNKNSPVTGVPINQIYSTRKDAQGKWVEVELAEGLYEVANGGDELESNSAGQEGEGGQKRQEGTAELGVCCFSADGHTMYFTYSKPINGMDLGAHIYTSSRASGTWAEPQEVKLFKDSTITCGHPALSYTGDTLYFASDAPNGYGGKDIWYSVQDGGNWSVPMNMGPQINTSGDEMFPTIRKDGTLYFSSNGHPGYGGLDIFKAVPDSMVMRDSILEQGWQLFNMGTPFNSNGDDFGITFAGDSEDGFFSSNRGQKKGQDMIYSFVLPELVFAVEGTVSDNMGETLSNATIRIVGDDGTNAKLQARRDGTYRVKLQKDVRYVMLATARGYLNQKQELKTHGLRDSYTYTQNFVLTTLSKPVKMENVFYEFAKWNITKESEAALDELVKLLNDNPNITIELSAHTDLVGNAAANKILSEKRAQSCVSYLIKKGIESERLTPVGYGKERPVVADKALHDKYPFIPVEQELNEEFILALPKDQQEVCNQINRRTEFKVLKTTYKLY